MLTEVWQAELVPPCEPDCDAAYGPFPDQPPYGAPPRHRHPLRAICGALEFLAGWCPAAGWWDVAWEEVS